MTSIKRTKKAAFATTLPPPPPPPPPSPSIVPAAEPICAGVRPSGEFRVESGNPDF
jgi:hypothetical protein